jgi:molybdopterin converting factor small subunit
MKVDCGKMPIKVRVYAPGFISHEAIDQDGYVQLAEGSSVRHLYRKMQVSLIARLLVTSFVNYEPAKMNRKLEENDIVSLMFPVSGG